MQARANQVKGLFPYQRQAIAASVGMLTSGAKTILNLSDTGTGKTVMALSTALSAGKWPYVICPKHLKENWRREAARWEAPILGPIHYEQLTAKAVPVVGSRDGRVFEWPEQILAGVDNRNILLIFDEAHRMMGIRTKSAGLLVAAARQGIQSLLLSATLIENPLRCRALGYALGWHRLLDFEEWLVNSCGCVETKWGLTLDRDFDSAGHLANLVRPHAVRVSQDEIEDFPETLTYPVFASGGKRIKASTSLEEYVARSVEAEKAKIGFMLEMINDDLAQGHSSVVFLNYREPLDFMAQCLTQAGVECGVIHGDVPISERQRIVDGFQNNEFHVILLQTQAASTGLNLHDFHGRPRVSLISPSDDSKLLLQALGRIPRAGAVSKSVQRIVFLSESSFDMARMKRLEGKVSMIEIINNL